MEEELHAKKELVVREFLFTEEEIEEDWKKYEKILNLRSILKPNAARIVTDDTL